MKTTKILILLLLIILALAAGCASGTKATPIASQPQSPTAGGGCNVAPQQDSSNIQYIPMAQGA